MGKIKIKRRGQRIEVVDPNKKCQLCDGTGEVHSHNPICWDCGGTGHRTMELFRYQIEVLKDAIVDAVARNHPGYKVDLERRRGFTPPNTNKQPVCVTHINKRSDTDPDKMDPAGLVITLCFFINELLINGYDPPNWKMRWNKNFSYSDPKFMREVLDCIKSAVYHAEYSD